MTAPVNFPTPKVSGSSATFLEYLFKTEMKERRERPGMTHLKWLVPKTLFSRKKWKALILGFTWLICLSSLPLDIIRPLKFEWVCFLQMKIAPRYRGTHMPLLRPMKIKPIDVDSIKKNSVQGLYAFSY